MRTTAASLLVLTSVLASACAGSATETISRRGMGDGAETGGDLSRPTDNEDNEGAIPAPLPTTLDPSATLASLTADEATLLCESLEGSLRAAAATEEARLGICAEEWFAVHEDEEFASDAAAVSACEDAVWGCEATVAAGETTGPSACDTRREIGEYVDVLHGDACEAATVQALGFCLLEHAQVLSQRAMAWTCEAAGDIDAARKTAGEVEVSIVPSATCAALLSACAP